MVTEDSNNAERQKEIDNREDYMEYENDGGEPATVKETDESSPEETSEFGSRLQSKDEQ